MNDEFLNSSKSHTKLFKMLLFTLLIVPLLILVYGCVNPFDSYDYGLRVSVSGDAYFNGLLLSDKKSVRATKKELVAAAEDFSDVTYLDVASSLDDMINTDGTILGKIENELKYLGTTFYLTNTGDKSCDYLYKIKIDDELKKVSKAIRILVVEGGETSESYDSLKLYKAFDEAECLYTLLAPEVNTFVNDKIVCENIIRDFKPGQIKKFTFIMWIDSEDIDFTPDMLEGKIKLSLEFSTTLCKELTLR